jgi:hypothetical protein
MPKVIYFSLTDTIFIDFFFATTVNLVKNNGKFGVKLANGSFTGALGNLQRRQSDVVTTAFFMKVLYPIVFIIAPSIYSHTTSSSGLRDTILGIYIPTLHGQALCGRSKSTSSTARAFAFSDIRR